MQKSGPPTQLVWFKRDLRVQDHAPLSGASLSGPLICLYLYEPEILHSPEFSPAHLVFINQSLLVLRQALQERGGNLLILHGEAVDCLEKIHRNSRFQTLWSHAETGNRLTFLRDLRVADWCRDRGVMWKELRQDGVIRRLKSRDGWAKRWEERMSLTKAEAPAHIQVASTIEGVAILSPKELGLGLSQQEQAQKGGEEAAQHCLDSFLNLRGVNYRSDMSSPLTGWQSCSRLSPYLAWGCISLRTVAQAGSLRTSEIHALRDIGENVDRRWLGSMRSFQSRLHWHCHFMQKLEDDPRIEFENFVRAYDGLREEFTLSPEGQRRYQAWVTGQTGYPMVDASLRCVHATGWLNFRMRAMVASFAAYYLGLHWRPTGLWLGRQFLDFEPGIHWSQFQMQSGTTGINILRIYSPAKQALDHDPGGHFIRRWVPELSKVPLHYLSRPELMNPEEQREAGCRIGLEYPAPIVDHVLAPRQAKAQITELRQSTGLREEARKVYLRHGSRKKSRSRPQSPVKLKKKNDLQIGFDF
jgi:deoxyribodipyrimidine photo-lyase